MQFHSIIYPKLSSTNEILLEKRHDADFHGKVICALEQSAGRGRRGRNWTSAKGNLAFSLGFRCFAEEVKIYTWLPFFVGIVLHEVLARYLTAEAVEFLSLKWPNDILWKEKKLCGVLTQVKQEKDECYFVVGVGLNLKSAPLEFPAIAFSDLPLQKALPSIESFLQEILTEMEKQFPNIDQPSLLKKAWERRAKFFGKEIRYGNFEEAGAMEEGIALSLSEAGGLLVKNKKTGKILSLISDDISIRY